MPYCNPPENLELNVPKPGMYDGIVYTLLSEHKTEKALVQQIRCQSDPTKRGDNLSYVETKRYNIYPVFGGPLDGQIKSNLELGRENMYNQYHSFNAGSKGSKIPSMIFMHESYFKL